MWNVLSLLVASQLGRGPEVASVNSLVASGVSSTVSANAPVMDPAAMDRSVDPCTDLYTYSCGGWLKANPIPNDEAQWSAYGKLQRETDGRLREILEAEQDTQLGRFYRSCMNEQKLDELKDQPSKALQNEVMALPEDNGKLQLVPLVQWLAKVERQGLPGLWSFWPQQDFRDSSRWVASLDQLGQPLPERDYYLKNDKRSAELRDDYKKHISRVLQLAGVPPAEADKRSLVILQLEVKLAKASMAAVERNDSKKMDHWTTLDALLKQSKPIPFVEYFAAHEVQITELNVAVPGYITQLAKLLKSESASTWKSLLHWRVLYAVGAQLDGAFRDERFAFFGKRLRGAKEVRPRWKTCVSETDDLMGEALGKVFVEKYFAGDAKTKTSSMVQQVAAAMGRRLQNLPWMSAPARQLAQQKLSRMGYKIGYPDKWRDYSSVAVDSDFFGNSLRLAAFDVAREMKKIGKPVERGEWFMSPPTVNAYYDAQQNDMNFPAGILMPPLFDAAGDMAANYGNTGSTVGHELTHGFDSDGRQYDPNGNLKDWWSRDDEKRFKERAQCIVKQYSSYEIVKGVKINGELTLGEDIADLGGVILAYEAMMANEGKDDSEEERVARAQRFFVAYGQSFCTNSREEEQRLRAVTDVHSPGKFRVNGVVANIPEFAQAFSCPANAPLVNKKVCRVW